MLNNVQAKKKFTHVIIALIVVCLTVTGFSFLMNDSIRSASAATRSVNVGAIGDWNTAMNNAASGDIINVTVTGDISATALFAAVKSGVTVNLNMNGHTIAWDYQAAGGGDTALMSLSYPPANTYWGLFTNNGTLNITGTGTIRMKQISYNNKVGSRRDDYCVKGAAIVNSGTLSIGSGDTIEAYIAKTNNESNTGGCSSDLFVYCAAIYNTGSVTSAGKINAGAYAATSSIQETNSYHYAFAYGIYGASGSVAINGGSITASGRSGGIDASGTCKEGNQMVNYAVGIFSNNCVVKGDTTITTDTVSWMSNGGNDCWGTNVSLSVGVMYTTTNYPTIGASVDISSSFKCCNDSGEPVTIPGANPELLYTVSCQDDCDTYYRRAYAVAGFPKNENTIGMHSAEVTFDGNGTTYTGTGDYTASSTKYYAEDPKYDNATGDTYLTDSSSQTQIQSGNRNAETKTSVINNGVPGNLGGQYVIVYRYYNGSVDPANLSSVSYTYDSSKQVSKQYLKDAGTTTYKGTIINGSNTITLGTGGASKNDYYYKYEGATIEKVSSASYSTRSITNLNNWKTAGSTFPTGGTTLSNSQTLIVYMNYALKDPSHIRVAASNAGSAGQEISQYTDTTEFTVEYTGKTIVPGTDFNIGIIDMGMDTTVATNDMADDTVVTNVYNVTGNGSGSGSNATAVTYRYSSDGGTTYTAGLPKNVGTYTIEVSVNADTTFASAGTYNRLGGTFTITGTITKADVSITGATSKSGTYGSTYGEIVDLSSYTVTGKNSESVSGSIGITGKNVNSYPNAGSETIELTWTPSGASAANYNSTSYNVSLVVNARSVAVSAGSATVAYGDTNVNYELSYTNRASCDDSKVAGWLENTTFQIFYNNAWVEYSAGIPAGTYNMKIATFGGAADTNNNFTLNGTNGTLTVEKRSLIYTAATTDRAYDTTANVGVTLTYASGAYGTDSFATSITTTGVMTNANAGQGKAVTVDVTAIDIQPANTSNYTLVISNKDTLTVNISKADPTGIACVAGTPTVVYDKTATLADIALNATETAVAGTWSWANAAIVPSCDVASYTANFTPTDTNNYNSATQAVAVTVTKAPVTVSVAPKTLTYGDAVPSMTAAYTGFTGDDTIDTVAITGNNEITTTYTRGSGVGTYPITVTTTLSSVNYEFTAQNSTVTVGKKALTITAANDTATYGAAAPAYDAFDLTATGFYGSDTLASLSGTPVVATTYVVGNAAGDYPINVSGYTSANYEITYVPGTLTIGKAELTVTPTAQNITYGAELPAYAASNLYTITGFAAGDTAATVTISGAPVFSSTYTSGRSVGSYPVTTVVTSMSTDNYTFKAVNGTLVVGKATPNVVTAPSASVVNGNKYGTATMTNDAVVQNPNSSAMTVAGTFSFDAPDTVAVFGDDNFYAATFVPTDTTNYNSVTVAGGIYLEITVKTITGTPVISGSPMAGSTLTINFASMDPTASQYYTYQWYKDSAPIAGATAINYAVTNADIGGQLYVIVTAKSTMGYSGSAPSAKTTQVIQALTPATVAQLAYTAPLTNYTYNAQTHSVTVTVKSEYAGHVGDITVKYNGSAALPKNAGTYNVTVDIGTPALTNGDTSYNSSYYGPVSGLAIGTFEIAQANYNVTFTPADKIYDGTASTTATVATSGVYGTDNVSLASGYTFAFADANVGTAKAVTASGLSLTGTSASNYKIVAAPATANITPATLRARANGVSKEYDGTTAVNVTFSNITGYADIDSDATVSIINGAATAVSANVGTQTLANITYTLSGSSAGNYVVEIINASTASVVITKATPSVTAPVISGLTYDSARVLQSIDLTSYSSANGYWVFDNLSDVPSVSTTQYAATYKSLNTNYNDYSGFITINVTAAPLVISANNLSITYGAAVPSYTLSISGFTGDDTAAVLGGGVTYSCAYIPGASTGTYGIVVNNGYSSDNYTFTTVPGTLTVAPATLVVNASSVNKTYDGNSDITVNFNVVSGKYGSDDVLLSTTSVVGVAASANAGTTTVTYTAPTLQGTKASNYELLVTPASNVLTVVINKADVTGVVFPTEGKVEFGYTLATATFATPGSGVGTFAYENANTTTPTSLGVFNTYTVVFTPTDARNYNSQSQVVTLTVIKCQLNYVVGIAGTAQSGNIISAAITGMPTFANDYIHYQWFRVNSNGSSSTAIAGATNATYSLTDEDVGYTMLLFTYFDDTAPFEYSEYADVVSPDGSVYGIAGQTAHTIKEITLSFWQRLIRWFQSIIEAITGLGLNVGRK